MSMELEVWNSFLKSKKDGLLNNNGIWNVVLNDIYTLLSKMDKEQKTTFGRKLRNQLICISDDTKDKPAELEFFMFMCRMLCGESLLLIQNGTSLYLLFLDIIHNVLVEDTPKEDFRHVILAFGFKYDFMKMVPILKTKYFVFEHANMFIEKVDDIVQKIIF